MPLSVKTLHAYLSAHFDGYEWRIVIVDNGSDDATPDVSRRLARELAGVSPLRLEERGRGLALRTAWLESYADVVAYMDVDLSTDLASLQPLVGAVATGGCDVAIGSRLIRGARVERRPLKREITSRGYSLLFRSMFFTGFRDAQCGLQGAEPSSRQRTRSASREQPMVLRHGAAHSGRGERLSDTRAARALDRRS